MKIIGNETPRYNFGIRGTAEYKGFDFTLFFQGTMKRDIIPSKTFYLSHYSSQWSVPQKMNYDYWREDNREASSRALASMMMQQSKIKHFLC